MASRIEVTNVELVKARPWLRSDAPPSPHELADASFDDEDVRDEPSPEAPQWRVHDRTHLELGLSYAADGAAARWEWEAYFFVPESFHVNPLTYPKPNLYSDFKSYMRLALSPSSLLELGGAPLDALEKAVKSESRDAAVRELRLFACRVRRAGVDGVRRIETLLERDREQAERAIGDLVAATGPVTSRLRSLANDAGVGEDRLAVAIRWAYEDASLVMETLLGRLAEHAKKSAVSKQSIRELVGEAVAQARQRRAAGFSSVADSDLNAREVERLEFRRHTLKRFTSSVLWLSAEVYAPGAWARHALFAVAAMFAMALAIAIMLYNGDSTSDQLPVWLAVAIGGYALKDRLKASLQDAFQKLLSRRFPDRRWRIRDRERQLEVATVDERSGFVPFGALPSAVLDARRVTRGHPLEEEARPELVIRHKKVVSIDEPHLRRGDERFHGLFEVFRVDLARWLAHTDDAKNRIVLADPDRGRIDSVAAPRVYNVAVVYRLLRENADAPWHRVRVVVSRKGIRRVEPIC